MRRGALVALLAVLVGAAPLFAQESPGIIPAPKQADGTPIPRQIKPKPASKRAAKTPLKTPRKRRPKTKLVTSDAARVDVSKSDIEKGTADGGALAGIPHDERRAIRSALLWAGDLAGAQDDDDAMLAAVKSFQKRKKYKVTGALTDAQRAELIAATKERESKFGWRLLIDPVTGIRVGLPAKMLAHAQPDGTGTRWSSKHGDVQVATFRLKAGGTKLAALFEDEKKKKSRRVESSALGDDTFSISGSQGLKNFSVRAQVRNGEIRGYTVLYDRMMETIVAPVVAAMASAFAPFPERSGPIAALTRKVDYGTGLIVSANGYILTDRGNTRGCQVVIAAGIGSAEQVAEDSENGVALLRVYGARKLAPVSFATAPKEAALTLLGIPDPREQDGRGKPAAIKARLMRGNAIELRDPVPLAGFSGAAALDDKGRVLGMMETRNARLASNGPAVPPVRLVAADTIRAFLAREKVPLAMPAHDTDAKASIVRVICVRK